jgi:hypothetical protein
MQTRFSVLTLSSPGLKQIEAGSIPDALLSCRPVQSNPIVPFNSKRSRLPNPAVRGGMATPVRATGRKVRIARHSEIIVIRS